MRSPRSALAVAIVCGLVAAGLTWSLAQPRGAAAGPKVAVLVVTEPLRSGTPLTADQAAGLELRSVPREYAPADALGDTADAVGARPIVDLQPGAWLTSSAIAGSGGRGRGFKLRAAERALTVEVTVSPSGQQLSPGDRVDLVASGLRGGDATESVLTAAEVLAADAVDERRTRATVRVAVGQVPAVVRADVYAKELRAVALP